ncbi:MAG: VWA domain-containing protein [Chthoniobacteraceae bacterium]|nr:VWA domain-containing protein [Chthoniobacteraceae bacterium]
MISFTNSSFLYALAGAAVPILIHLFTRDRVKRAAFSTLRFFAKGAKLVVRRKKFQEAFLIALRVLLVALLVSVFARPYFKTKNAAAGADVVQTARVVVTDVSGSMRRAGMAEALKKETLGAFESLKEGEDKAALIAFDETANVREPLGGNLAQIKAAAVAIAPGYGSTDLSAALRKANELLRGVAAKRKEVVLISDLSREGWRPFKGDWKLAADVQLTLRPLNPADTRSRPAIVEASAPGALVLDGQPSSIAVRVANFSDEPCNDLEVALELGGSKADSQKVNIRPHGTAAVRFRHVFDTPGDHPGAVKAGKEEAFYFNARTLPRIPVLIINGRPSANPQEDAAFFVAKALSPGEGSPFAPRIVTADKVSPKDVSAAGVVILADAGAVPGPVADALDGLLQRGGGVLFLPGGQVKAEAFNTAFGAMAPCKLRQILTARPANGENAESLTRIDFEHPVFEAFSQPHHGDLTLPKFAKYWETTDTQRSRVLARFGDGRPAILERGIGKGVAMALVSAVESDWTDFATRSVFLPTLHQMARYLAVRGGQRTAFACGESLPVPDGETLRDPAGKTSAENVAAQPGLYAAIGKEGKPDFCYAVNGSFAEGDPATVAPGEIQAAIGRAPGEMLGGVDPDAGLCAAEEDRPKDSLWWVLLCGLVLASMAELAVSNKTLRH